MDGCSREVTKRLPMRLVGSCSVAVCKLVVELWCTNVAFKTKRIVLARFEFNMCARQALQS